MLENIVPDDGPLSSDGTQYATVKLLRIFQSTIGVYGMARLKPLGR